MGCTSGDMSAGGYLLTKTNLFWFPLIAGWLVSMVHPAS